MNWIDTVMKLEELRKVNVTYPNDASVNEMFDCLMIDVSKTQAEISFKAGIKYVLSRAVQDGCLSRVNDKHGVHIPDELYDELKRESK